MSAAAVQVPELEPVRFSRLKLMGRSPAHYAAAVRTETGAMRRGTAVHSLLLGGNPVVAYPGAVRRGKEWDAFEREHVGDVILTRSQYEQAQAIAESVRQHPEAMRVLEGTREQEIDWRYLGRACRSRVDVVGPGGAWITDLKTTACSDPSRFTLQAIRMAYHAQCAFYRDAVIGSGLGTAEAAYVVAVESSAPYTVTVLRLTPRALDLGARLVRLWFERLLACEASDYWPGYCEAIMDLDVDEEMELQFAEDNMQTSVETPF